MACGDALSGHDARNFPRSQSDNSLGHLCRQVGSIQAHIGFGGSVTLWSVISQLSIGLKFSPLHLGHVSAIAASFDTGGTGRERSDSGSITFVEVLNHSAASTSLGRLADRASVMIDCVD